MKTLIVCIGYLCYQLKRFYNFFLKRYLKTKFSHMGKNVYIGNGGIFTYENIEIDDDVYIGPNACFQSTFGKIKIGSHVMFGPGVHIHGGNHKIKEIGKLMKHASPKKAGDDGEVIIGDDVWIGSNAIILSNVTIGEGSVIGAGAVVTKNVAPYSVYTGVPSKKERDRFNPQELEEHKKILGGG